MMLFPQLAAVLWGSKMARIVVACLAGLLAIKLYGLYQQQVGKRAVIEQSIERGRQANVENSNVRKQASKPGAFERLLRDSCRDC